MEGLQEPLVDPGIPLPVDDPAVTEPHTAAVDLTRTNFGWLEITGKCQELCVDCLAESGPDGDHGTMQFGDWTHAIDDLAANGARDVQFIGGEPTLHPDLPGLIEHASLRGLGVEVYTNLVHVTREQWVTFSTYNVSLATSYFSADASVHRAITGRNTRNPIRRNIATAVQRGIDLRVGIISVRDDQDADGAVADLLTLGVPQDRIRIDGVRGVGRGREVGAETPVVDEFCGKCAVGKVAVLPDGRVQPCVFARQPEFTAGNVRQQPLHEILASESLLSIRGTLQAAFDQRALAAECNPSCPPMSNCFPNCNPTCSPWE